MPELLLVLSKSGFYFLLTFFYSSLTNERIETFYLAATAVTKIIKRKK